MVFDGGPKLGLRLDRTMTSDRCKSDFANAAVLAALSLLLCPALTTAASATPNLPARIEFNQHIRPILSGTCFPCHGFDSSTRKADLRLDIFEGATAEHQGRHALTPGDLHGSELWRRINATSADEHMPPPDSGKKLTPSQIGLLKSWIEQGAVYQKHWAFEPPRHLPPPPVRRTDWPRNDVDRFILAKLESQQLEPSGETTKETLIRRVTLDLSGLPPTLEETDAFLTDSRPEAYERLVDRLLASPRYGEHMARYWLDMARYGDTHGLHLDNERSIWPYRDWVVRAFNRNLSFDQFTIEQLGGDLLPNPTPDQFVASGFNRCNVSTSEGGAIDEEFQVRYAVDRVETTAATWLGLTMGCAVCHDHKLDPITQKEFYQVFTLFNNLAEKAMDGNALLPPPSLPLPTPEQAKRQQEFNTRRAALEERIRAAVKAEEYIDPALRTDAPKTSPHEIVWIDDDFPPKATVAFNEGTPTNRWITKDDGPVFSGQRALLRTGKGIHQAFFPECGEPLTVGAGDKLFAHVYLDPKDPPKAVMLQFHVGGGWSRRANWGDPDAIGYGRKGTTEKVQVGKLPTAGQWVRLEVDTTRLGLRPGTRITGEAFTLFDGTAWWDKAGQVSANDPARDPGQSLAAWEESERALANESAAPQVIKDFLKTDPAKRSAADRAALRAFFLTSVYAATNPAVAQMREEMKTLDEQRAALDKEIPATMISKELDPPRPAWVLIRGQYDKHGEPVAPGVPAILPPLPPGDVTNRLTFARWLVSTNHPLTARVTVNRFWQQFFGTGLVKTSEDFGSKGEWPSHPELLDWMATEFMDQGWNVKKFVRMLVTSATYRQDSSVTPKLITLDPENRLLARGPRHRLDAEVLRDNALFVGGLLNLTMGGRGVRPYQPPGIWEAVGYTTSNTAKYSQDNGDALYRRSLYTFWKRTAPPPAMTTFDAPSREQCSARRERTDTPLQALVLMNDPQYFEAARQLGYRMVRQGGSTDAERLRYGFRLVAARAPMGTENAVLTETLELQRARFSADAEAARKAIAVGDSPAPTDVPPAELAAYTMVANVLLNLDEVVTKN
jgi:hypothetical protein